MIPMRAKFGCCCRLICTYLRKFGESTIWRRVRVFWIDLLLGIFLIKRTSLAVLLHHSYQDTCWFFIVWKTLRDHLVRSQYKISPKIVGCIWLWLGPILWKIMRNNPISLASKHSLRQAQRQRSPFSPSIPWCSQCCWIYRWHYLECEQLECVDITRNHNFIWC